MALGLLLAARTDRSQLGMSQVRVRHAMASASFVVMVVSYLGEPLTF